MIGWSVDPHDKFALDLIWIALLEGTREETGLQSAERSDRKESQQ